MTPRDSTSHDQKTPATAVDVEHGQLPIIDTIVEGDCREIMATMPDGCIDFIYCDPPFATGTVRRDRAGAFDDRCRDMEAWLALMHRRLQDMARLLAPRGSMMLHCDWRTCHHVRGMLDAILGQDQFINHLVWSYGLGGSSPRRFARKHDDILFYSRTQDYYFACPRVPSTSRRMDGRPKKSTDVLAIPAINNMARERTGYPTQKPLALLKLLVGAGCPPGGVVLDPTCGSGTTLVAAQSHGCRYIGFDINPDAISIARQRLAGLVESTVPEAATG